jgi:hypothetical protein
MRRWAVPVAAIALPLCLFAELLPIRSYSTADGLAADRIDKIVKGSRAASARTHGMRMTDEKDKRTYALSGNAAGIRAGVRMTLEGKRKHDGPALAFETHKVGKDFGACPT